MADDKRDFLRDACLAAMIQVGRIQTLIISLHDINREMTSRERYYSTPYDRIKEPAASYSAMLHEALVEAQKRLLTFGLLTEDEELKKEAFKKVLEDTFESRDGIKMQIMGYLEVDGMSPSGYFTDEEEEFRKQISEAVRRELGALE